MLTTKQIEEQIEHVWITPIRVYDERAEFGIKIPFFMEAFNRYVTERGKVPSPDQFYSFYTSINYGFFEKLRGDKRLTIGIEARAKRAYPSLVRDLHLTALLQENGLEAVYDANTDMNEGVDQIINYNGLKFHVHCFVNTNRSNSARRAKNDRHEFKGIHIDMPLDLDSPNNITISNVKLYSKHSINILKAEMDKHCQKVSN